jgi:hypothetical protein
MNFLNQKIKRIVRFKGVKMNDEDFLKIVKGMSKEELETKLPFICDLTKIISRKLKEEEQVQK